MAAQVAREGPVEGPVEGPPGGADGVSIVGSMGPSSARPNAATRGPRHDRPGTFEGCERMSVHVRWKYPMGYHGRGRPNAETANRAGA